MSVHGNIFHAIPLWLSYRSRILPNLNLFGMPSNLYIVGRQKYAILVFVACMILDQGGRCNAQMISLQERRNLMHTINAWFGLGTKPHEIHPALFSSVVSGSVKGDMGLDGVAWNQTGQWSRPLDISRIGFRRTIFANAPVMSRFVVPRYALRISDCSCRKNNKYGLCGW